ncbi:MAG: flagellar basal body-associated FliL family protein [Lachnospiraceae bacterium]|nr:flagellar basal body-associated FliL family protein [Lachnospiraceae bacterium]
MKKNILAIVILAATIVNITLSIIILFTIVPKAQRTDALIQKIVSVIDLELESPDADDYGTLAAEDQTIVDLANTITCTLQSDEGESKTHYGVVSVSMVLNSKSEDYAAKNTYISTNERVILNIIDNVVSQYTVKELKSTEVKESIRKAVISKCNAYFNSPDLIYNVILSITAN